MAVGGWHVEQTRKDREDVDKTNRFIESGTRRDNGEFCKLVDVDMSQVLNTRRFGTVETATRQ